MIVKEITLMGLPSASRSVGGLAWNGMGWMPQGGNTNVEMLRNHPDSTYLGGLHLCEHVEDHRVSNIGAAAA